MEREYFERTRLFPIMHAVVLHPRVMRESGIAKKLFDAYSAAKSAAFRRRLSAAFLPGAERLWEGLTGDGTDCLRYGLTPLNRQNIDLLSRYLREQGLIDTIPPIDSLFVEGAAEWSDE